MSDSTKRTSGTSTFPRAIQRRLFWHRVYDWIFLGPIRRRLARRALSPALEAAPAQTIGDLEAVRERFKKIVGAFVTEPDAGLIVDIAMGEVQKYDLRYVIDKTPFSSTRSISSACVDLAVPISKLDNATFHFMVRVCIELYFKGPIPPHAVSGSQWAKMQRGQAMQLRSLRSSLAASLGQSHDEDSLVARARRGEACVLGRSGGVSGPTAGLSLREHLRCDSRMCRCRIVNPLPQRYP